MIRRAPSHGISSVHGPLGPGQVSNITNSNDFISKDSRVFVGNLNTFVLTKEDVDAIFRRYGIVTGISMHKGYAFVQYGYPGEARRAISFENGHMYAGQAIDLNIVSEPKHRPAQKRNAGPGTNDRRPPMQSSPTMAPAAKRPRQDSNPSLQRSNLVTLADSGKSHGRPRQPPRSTPFTAANKVAAAAVKRATATVTKSATNAARASSGATASTPATDVLICGVCKMQFTSLHSLAQHKKVPCRLRTSCQCQTNPPPKQQDDQLPTELDCASCDAKFDSAWSLCQHCHDEHNMSIYKTKDSANLEASSEDKNDKEAEGTAKKAEAKNTTPIKK